MTRTTRAALRRWREIPLADSIPTMQKAAVYSPTVSATEGPYAGPDDPAPKNTRPASFIARLRDALSRLLRQGQRKRVR